MAVKKVFSFEKWKQDMLAGGASEESLSLFTWPRRCDGLTAEEMCDMGYMTVDAWMVVVEE